MTELLTMLANPTMATVFVLAGAAMIAAFLFNRAADRAAKRRY